MKKVFVIYTLLCAMSVSAFSKSKNDKEFIVKAGIQPQSIVSAYSKKLNTSLGFSGGFEYFQYFGNIFALGGGAIYDSPRTFQDKNYSGNLSFFPLYAGLKVRTPLHGLDNNYMFFSGRLGYSALITTKDIEWKSSVGGLYYGVGLGISINVLVIEVIYAISNFTYQTASNSKNDDGTYKTITFYVGFKFE
ncbi:MAG: hypothetical protein LBT18_00225 [Endomicrobium sp.]|jgi:hypothetical protein|nr:hypothetical protein [Endomicrobium sp.]